MDAFIASWDSKRYYDSSRPWSLVRHYYAGKTIKGWAGPGKGVMDIPAEKWHPYSPASFVTPPFPGVCFGTQFRQWCRGRDVEAIHRIGQMQLHRKSVCR